MEYARERLADLMRAYREYAATHPIVRMEEAARAVVGMPSARFWVTDERAAAVVRLIMDDRGVLRAMRRTKRRMYAEICRRVAALRERDPEKSLMQLCAAVVRQPAPEFYIAPGTARVLICRGRKLFRNERRQKPPRSR